MSRLGNTNVFLLLLYLIVYTEIAFCLLNDLQFKSFQKPAFKTIDVFFCTPLQQVCGAFQCLYKVNPESPELLLFVPMTTEQTGKIKKSLIVNFK